MATIPTLHGLHNPLPRSQFLGQDHHFLLKQQPSTTPTHQVLKPRAKFNLFEIMGGRGLCNGEKGLQQELKRQVLVVPEEDQAPPQAPSSTGADQEGSQKLPQDGFEKEMMGLTGGFPGGEKGLKEFIEKNPPPKQATIDCSR
ncbi:NAD(P)H-quinone oxidoreductase subunit S, chloroplastic, partial [Mucuna pruriens]